MSARTAVMFVAWFCGSFLAYYILFKVPVISWFPKEFCDHDFRIYVGASVIVGALFALWVSAGFSFKPYREEEARRREQRQR